MKIKDVKRITRKAYPDFWMLTTALLTILFVIAIDWFSKSLLHLFFGTGADDQLLIQGFPITLSMSDKTLISVHANALLIAMIFLAIYLYFWLRRPLLLRNIRDSNNDFPREPDASLLKATEKLKLFSFLFFFAIGLGWISSGLEQLLVGDIAELKTISPFFRTAIAFPFSLAFVSLIYITKRDKTLFRRQAIPFLMFVVATWLIVFAAPDNAVLHVSILFGLLALLWGYILFKQVTYHATPKNFMRAVNQNPDRQKHLVFFVSYVHDRPSLPKAQTISDFKDSLDRNDQGIPRNLVDNLRTKVNEWVEKNLRNSSEKILPPNLLDHLAMLHKKILAPPENTALAQPSETLKRIESELAEPVPSEGFAIKTFSGNLLALNLIIIVLKDLEEDIHEKILLSSIIKYLQRITGNVYNWLMPVLSVEYHLAPMDDKAGPKSVLEQASFIFSKSTVKEGSVNNAQCFAWLMEDIFKIYYGVSEEELEFSWFKPSSKNEKPELKTLFCSATEAGTQGQYIGIDFESYEECSDSIRHLTESLSIYETRNIVIDFTGGQKTTTMAAVLATTNSDVKSQYIGTNDYEVYGFDLRYHDIKALIS